MAALPLPLLTRGAGALLLYYRRDVLAAANLSVPATWSQLLAAAQALHGSSLGGSSQPAAGVCAEWMPGEDGPSPQQQAAMTL